MRSDELPEDMQPDADVIPDVIGILDRFSDANKDMVDAFFDIKEGRMDPEKVMKRAHAAMLRMNHEFDNMMVVAKYYKEHSYEDYE